MFGFRRAINVIDAITVKTIAITLSLKPNSPNIIKHDLTKRILTRFFDIYESLISMETGQIFGIL